MKEFMSTNVCSREIREKRKVLIYGSCIKEEYPEILEKFREKYVLLSVCLEKEHMNMVGFKLLGMMKRSRPEEIVVLTVDGSPHCVQLHFTIEECSKILEEFKERIVHLVIENGKIRKISPETVKICRYLTKVERILTRNNKN